MQNSEELTANEGDEKLEVTSVFAVATEGRLRRQLESWHLGAASEGFRMWCAEVLDGRTAGRGLECSPKCPLSLRSQSLQPSHVSSLAHFPLSVNKSYLSYLLNTAPICLFLFIPRATSLI